MSKPILGILLVAALLLVGCFYVSSLSGEALTAADNGARLIREFDCGVCHNIPGIRGADGVLGPPLNHFSRRAFIAGRVSNNRDNLVRWLVDPQNIDELTAMPRLGLDGTQAQNIASYLYTLN